MNILPNYINNKWQKSPATENIEITNPATAELLAKVPLSSKSEVNEAAESATKAFKSWRRTPASQRVQFLFLLKYLLEEHLEDIARTITFECGKTLVESRIEMRRAIENVEIACGIPMMLGGNHHEDIVDGIDGTMIRQPLGVCAAICSFSFPGMIPLWFLPYALACGNTYIVKPSEKVPLTMQKIFQLLEQTGLPEGVVNLVNGSKETVDAIVEHPQIKAISFVGSTSVAKYIYSWGAANSKRMQCHGGAKNPIVILPDADIVNTTRIAADSAFGCAGQTCLAASIAITVGEAQETFTQAIVEAANKRVVGNGLDDKVEMGPVINAGSKTRIEGLIEKGTSSGAKLLLDGRNPLIPGYEQGNFIRPTILEDVNPLSEIANTEIFGPVLSLIHVNNIDEAISLVNDNPFGKMACLFTASVAAARKFRYEAETGSIGINIAPTEPTPFLPFSSCKKSFFGDLHGQGNQAVEFFTQTKTVLERWSSKSK
ncbi:methylmalonate-semialdehyde dehydrogenase [Calothrix parasitica NIES-267]|uniref:methylmalonate-semialdehyde dehydrogenase (CoA acylating) n=1 Tax=Calothrix parasitica NIES-267 TaxID=1973488 RepID=A0A1Z4LIL6_9CYAN|nr:methylmalonate-semialdehyde dehydrogenase [Calothrix parasitica NIES-267]